MGAHEEFWGFGGNSASPRELISKGYLYFKYCSFLPCNLFRTDFFYNSIIKAYSNIVNWYPHIPFLMEFFNRDEIIYIAKKRIVTAVIGNQEYPQIQLIINWFNCAQFVNGKKQKLIFLLNQFACLSENKQIGWNRILVSTGINSFYNKNVLVIVRLFKVTNIYQTILLLLSLLVSPLWYIKRKLI
jgi:hypothetical protein